jgi:GlpG protein
MADSHQALSVAVDEDLLPLSVLLHQRGVAHRIFEASGRQVVIVEQASQVVQVQSLYNAWRAGELRIELSRRERPAIVNVVTAAGQWRTVPVTLILILLSICGFLLVYLSAPAAWVSYLTFTAFRLEGDHIAMQEFNGQYWRLVTPVFLHFSWLHIVFNSLWLWDLGGRVERVLGHFNMFMLFMVIAVVSNASQFAFGGGGLFGGMSGVVYGLLGFSWVAPLLQPRWQIKPTSAIMLVMTGWLVLCMAGMVEVLGFGAIANAAHVGGLLCGAALGVLLGALSRATGDNSGSATL